jgi:hypothetical protein
MLISPTALISRIALITCRVLRFAASIGKYSSSRGHSTLMDCV